MKKDLDLAILVIRLTLGILMLLHGINKLFHGVAPIEKMLQNSGFPSFFAYGVYIGEVIAPVFLIFGYRTRIAALVLAFNCFVAALLAHSKDIFSITPYGGWGIELLGLYFFSSLALFLSGSGKYAFLKD